MKNGHYEIRLSGTGGQGMMLMGDVLSQAAGCIEGKEIILTKSYGPESRGGACRSELIIDEKPINYPTMVSPDFVLAMSQKACDAYHYDLKEDSKMLVDSDLVLTTPDSVKKIYSIPLTRIAKETTNKEITANVVALGAVAVLAEVASVESIFKAVMARFPENLHKMNEVAFNAGVEAAKTLIQIN